MRFAFSTSCLSLPNARRLVETSVPVFFSYCLTKYTITVIEILTTEVGITSSSQDPKDTVIDREKRNVECATSEVIDDDPGFGLGLLVKAVGNSSGDGFIDDTEDLQAGDRALLKSAVE